jgi:hypothetical protein
MRRPSGAIGRRSGIRSRRGGRDSSTGSPASASRRKPVICFSLQRFFIGPISVSG